MCRFYTYQWRPGCPGCQLSQYHLHQASTASSLAAQKMPERKRIITVSQASAYPCNISCSAALLISALQPEQERSAYQWFPDCLSRRWLLHGIGVHKVKLVLCLNQPLWTCQQAAWKFNFDQLQW